MNEKYFLFPIEIRTETQRSMNVCLIVDFFPLPTFFCQLIGIVGYHLILIFEDFCAYEMK